MRSPRNAPSLCWLDPSSAAVVISDAIRNCKGKICRAKGKFFTLSRYVGVPAKVRWSLVKDWESGGRG